MVLGPRLRRPLVTSVVLVAVLLAASAVPFAHKPGREGERDDCVACRVTLQTVAIQVPVLATLDGLAPLGHVVSEGPEESADGTARPASSRGPPLA